MLNFLLRLSLDSVVRKLLKSLRSRNSTPEDEGIVFDTTEFHKLTDLRLETNHTSSFKVVSNEIETFQHLNYRMTATADVSQMRGLKTAIGHVSGVAENPTIKTVKMFCKGDVIVGDNVENLVILLGTKKEINIIAPNAKVFICDGLTIDKLTCKTLVIRGNGRFMISEFNPNDYQIVIISGATVTSIYRKNASIVGFKSMEDLEKAGNFSEFPKMTGICPDFELPEDHPVRSKFTIYDPEEFSLFPKEPRRRVCLDVGVLGTIETAKIAARKGDFKGMQREYDNVVGLAKHFFKEFALMDEEYKAVVGNYYEPGAAIDEVILEKNESIKAIQAAFDNYYEIDN